MKKLIEKSAIKEHLFDNMSISFGGFMANGTSEIIVDQIIASGVKNLTIVCNDGGYEDRGVGRLVASGQVKKLIASHIGLNPMVGQLMNEGKLEVELVPQGTLAERVRAGGNGIGGFYTPVGIGTSVEDGKEKKVIDGKEYLLEMPIKTDLSVVRAYKVDNKGNAIYRKTSRNFNPLVAMNSEVVIASTENIVDKIDGDEVVTPHIFIDYIVEE